MLNKNNERELCYLVKVDDIKPIPGRDRVESAIVGGWQIMCKKEVFKPGSIGIYFEIDSQVPAKDPFMFLESKHFKIKTQKYKIPDGQFWSQGLLMHPEDFNWKINGDTVIDNNRKSHRVDDESRFLTKELGVVYNVAEDNTRKANSVDKYKAMAQRNGKLFGRQPFRWLMKRPWGRKLLFVFFGKKKDNPKGWPVGKFPGVSKTDQERVENMPWVLSDKTPYIRTQKCDGSSGTFILEHKKHNKFEFYVCSRNVRMIDERQECFYGFDNYYWQAAKKYNIEKKMHDYLDKHPELTFVCWQGEICAPGIQGNPHGLKDLHLFCFHWTDDTGRWDIRMAARLWKEYNMEVVPIDEKEYILPDDFEEFKLSADGLYDASCCQGNPQQKREGYVYYKTTDPNFSFKNVSREYLQKHNS